MKKKIGFIGCGKMGGAIIGGILSAKFTDSNSITASEYSAESAEKKSKELGIKVITDNKELVKNSDIIVIATKPNIVRDVLSEISSELSSEKLLVSIAAGVTIKTIEEHIPDNIHVIRVMPNTPALVSEGMFGITASKQTTQDEINYIKDMLSTLGKCIILPENQMDIVTAISGSGPAFFYKVIHEMALAGEKLGMDYQNAILLAAQTAIGSAKMLMLSDKTPVELINSVATKGGCTEVGVSYMNEANSEEFFFNVIKKTTDKARDLGKK